MIGYRNKKLPYDISFNSAINKMYAVTLFKDETDYLNCLYCKRLINIHTDNFILYNTLGFEVICSNKCLSDYVYKNIGDKHETNGTN